MAAEETNDPAAIEADVERTQDAMGVTLGKIEDRLNPHNLLESVLGNEGSDAARQAWDVVRQSPIPVALIAGGAAWLVATSKAPMIQRLRDELRSRFTSAMRSASSQNEPGRSMQGATSVGPPQATGEVFDRRRP